MAKKQYKDYDSTLVGKYIRQIENPDSIGWNPLKHIWEAPALPGYDTRNRGMGIDILNNDAAKLLTEGRPGKYLTEQEERDLRNKHIDYVYGALGRQTARIPEVDSLSPRKEAEAIGLLYRGDGKKLWNPESPLGKAFRSADENNFHRAVSEYYRSQGLNERARQNDLFWKNESEIINSPQPEQQPSSSFIDRTRQQFQDFTNRGTSRQWGDGGSLNPWYGLSMREKADIMGIAVNGGIYDLDAIRGGYNEFAKGGKIHIAPSKRGTFTAAAKRHGKSVQEFASQVLAHKGNYSPAMVKKANFARNASHWKHGLGGFLDEI